jgi:hypothetical protein
VFPFAKETSKMIFGSQAHFIPKVVKGGRISLSKPLSSFVMLPKDQFCTLCHPDKDCSGSGAIFSISTLEFNPLSKTCPLCQPLVIGHREPLLVSVFSSFNSCVKF